MRIVLDDNLDYEQVKAVFLSFIDHPEFETGMHVLWDARGVSTIDFDFDDVKAFGQFVASFAQRRGGGRSAMVASGDAMFGTFRVHKLLNEDTVSYEFQVFRDYEAARRWLLEADL